MGESAEEIISVIVPVYNAEQYIADCVESVLSQTYKNFELLIIDDGSQDNSRGICRSLCSIDKRIKLFCQTHRGVSAARNLGIEEAEGKYIFFLDSDDSIHPYLIENLVQMVEEGHCQMALCNFKKVKTYRMRSIKKKDLKLEKKADWRIITEKESEEWFHIDSTRECSCVGGLFDKDFIGALRFQEGMINGEDTLFMYRLVCKQVRIAYCTKYWYYYRMHTGSAIHSGKVIKGKGYLDCSRTIRDEEYKKNNIRFAVMWERVLIHQIIKKFSEFKKSGDKESCQSTKSQAFIEGRHPLFQCVGRDMKVLYFSCFFCYPLYSLCRKILYIMWKIKLKDVRGIRMKNKAGTGILTFHCADNYGAMLQAYGLKKYLCSNGIETEIVRYEPLYMTGRHWWIPYAPLKGIIGCLWLGWHGWKSHLRMGKDFFKLRANMGNFRNTYLCEKDNKKMLFSYQLRRLPYQYYIVGSDQIWNPDITFGLRKVYFGGFKNKRKKRVIAYAASLGKGSLKKGYNRKFSKLLKHVDVISLREKEAVSYVERFYQGKIPVVVDPVFLLGKESWESIEIKPEKKGYILVYVTEKNPEIFSYVKTLSKEKKLSIVELRISKEKGDYFFADDTAGPAEFLGYIHNADYVVTNSFHGVAFSIIYQKQFLAFPHYSYNARIENVIHICGLESRVYKRGKENKIDTSIDWITARKRMDEKIRLSKEFLMENISDGRN